MDYLDTVASKGLFNFSIAAVRKISVSNNDLPGRLAEVLAQLKARGNRRGISSNKNDWKCLELKVRSRMSMSVVFDSLWEWRRGFEVDESRDSSSASPNIPIHKQS